MVGNLPLEMQKYCFQLEVWFVEFPDAKLPIDRAGCVHRKKIGVSGPEQFLCCSSVSCNLTRYKGKTIACEQRPRSSLISVHSRGQEGHTEVWEKASVFLCLGYSGSELSQFSREQELESNNRIYWLCQVGHGFVGTIFTVAREKCNSFSYKSVQSYFLSPHFAWW